MAAMGEDYEPSPMAGTPGYGDEGNRGTGCKPDTNSKPMEVSETTAKLWEGYGTALKPAHEPVAEYVKGGGLPIVTESMFHYIAKAKKAERNLGCGDLFWVSGGDGHTSITKEEYDAKKANGEAVTEGNCWPTVKPIDLMRRLIRLVKRGDGTDVILDPFMGSGTTLMAAIQEGCDYVGIDADKVAYKISSARVDYSLKNDMDKKKKGKGMSVAQIVGAKKFLAMGFPPEKVASMVRLSIKQVKSL